MKSYKIRLMRIEDIEGMKRLMRRIFDRDYGYGYNPKYHKDYERLELIYKRKKGNFMYVVEDNESKEIIGMGGVKREGIKSKYVSKEIKERYEKEDVGKIVRLFVDDRRRRLGIGKDIVKKIKSKVKRDGIFKTIILSTEKAIPFWERMKVKKIYDERLKGGYEVYYELKL